MLPIRLRSSAARRSTTDQQPRTRILLLILVAAASACDHATAPQLTPAIASISLSRASAILAIAGHVQLTATAQTSTGAEVPNVAIAWNSDDPAATVSTKGVVTGVSAGRAKITASTGSWRANVAVTILNAAPGGMAITFQKPTLALGQVLQMQPIAFDAEGLGASVNGVTWTSNDPTVASVDATGRVSAIGTGSSTIGASVGGSSANAEVTVVAFTSIASAGLTGNFGLDPTIYDVPDSSLKTAICATTTAGALYCAGTGYGPLAVPVAPTMRFAQVKPSIGLLRDTAEFCALTVEGAPSCWQPGDTLLQLVPGVPGTQRFSSFTSGGVGGTKCGITTDSKTYCWGAGNLGQVGNGSFTASLIPVQVTTSESFADVVVHNLATCARTSGGRVFCWGGANISGQGVVTNLGVLGIGSETDSSATPVAVLSDVSFTKLDRVDTWTMCAFAADGKLYCWGGMAHKQDQYGKSRCHPNGFAFSCNLTPTEIPTDLRFTGLAPTKEGICALTTDGKVACWGTNHFGTFGLTFQETPLCLNNYRCFLQPTITLSDIRFASIVGGNGHNLCGIDVTGRALCWGGNVAGQLTDSSVRVSTPKPTVFAIDPNR